MEIRRGTRDDWAGIRPFYRTIVAARTTYAYDPDLSSDQAAEGWFRDAPGVMYLPLGRS